MATPEMIAAVSAAVKGEPPPAAPAPEPAAAEPPAPAAQSSEGDEPAAPAQEPAAAQPDLIGAEPPVAAQPVPDANGRLRNPDGTFAGAPEAAPAAPAAPAAAAPAKPVAPAAPAAPPDPVNDPISPNARPETRERITTLAGMVKERDQQLETTSADLEMLLAPIREAGASVPQFKESMTLLRLINSPHQHEQMQALEYLQGAAARLASHLGHVPPGTDPLVGNNDLIADVQAGRVTRAYAEEIARSRRLTAATQQHQRFTQQRSQEENQRQQAIEAGQSAVAKVEAAFKASDPQYEAKIALVMADKPFSIALRSMHPSQWASAFADKYASVRAPAVAASTATAVAPSTGAPAPLRAKQPAGTAARPPKTALEAVTAALRAG